MADGDVKQWLNFAKTDLGVAKHLMEHYYPKPLEIIGYHCQQSAEKAVKAVIMNLDRHMGIPQTHDISFLLN